MSFLCVTDLQLLARVSDIARGGLLRKQEAQPWDPAGWASDECGPVAIPKGYSTSERSHAEGRAGGRGAEGPATKQRIRRQPNKSESQLERHCFSSEIDRKARKVLRANFDPEVLCKDMRRRTSAARVDLYVTGPPCQPFSHAGRRAGFLDRDQGNILGYVHRYVERSRPKSFIIENVAGLCTIHEGAGLENLLHAFGKLKAYRIHHRILNSEVGSTR